MISPIPYLFPKNITQQVPVYTRINLHNIALLGVLCVIAIGLSCTFK